MTRHCSRPPRTDIDRDLRQARRGACVSGVRVGKRRPISRILSPCRSPGSGWRPSLWDVGHPTPRAAHLGRDGRTTLSLLGLAPDGACIAATVTRRAGGLLPHRFTLTACRRTGSRRSALCCAVHASPRLGVTQHPVLRSPDFPHPPERARPPVRRFPTGRGYAHAVPAALTTLEVDAKRRCARGHGGA
jgi:hypothetical protein